MSYTLTRDYLCVC